MRETWYNRNVRGYGLLSSKFESQKGHHDFYVQLQNIRKVSVSDSHIGDMSGFTQMAHGHQRNLTFHFRLLSRSGVWSQFYSMLSCLQHKAGKGTFFIVLQIGKLSKPHTTLTILKPAGHVIHHQCNIQQLCALPTLYLCVLYLSENKQRLVPLTA